MSATAAPAVEQGEDDRREDVERAGDQGGEQDRAQEVLGMSLLPCEDGPSPGL